MTLRKLAVVLSTSAALGYSGVSIAADETFGIQGIMVRGATLIDKTELRAATDPYIGRNRVYGDIQKVIETIENIYRKKGYSAVEVRLPEQDITLGTVEIQVVETVIGKVKVVGNEHFSQDNIRSSLPELAPGRTPNIRKLSENVQLANSNPSKQVDTVLAVSETEGQIDATITVKDQNPLRFVLSGDNTGTEATGKHRASVAVQHANLWGLDHVGTLAYATSVEEPSDLRSISFSYRVPFYRWGDSLDLLLGDSKVTTSTPTAGQLIPLQFVGAGSVAGLRYNHNFARSGEYVGRLILGIDQKKFENTCSFGGQTLAAAGCTHLTVRPISVTYGGQLVKAGSMVDYSLTALQNMPSKTNGDQTAISAVRAEAKDKYRVVRANGSWFGVLFGQWQGRLAVNAQLTADPLIGAESIGLAGSTAVRGFNERAVATDVGAVLNTEIYTPNLNETLRLNKFVGEATIRALAFVDVAAGRNLGTIVSPQVKSQSIASAGLGTRIDFQKNVSFRWDAAGVIKAAPKIAGAPVAEEKGDWRTHFSILLSY